MEDAPPPTVDPNLGSILSLVKQVQYKAYVWLEAAFEPIGITAVQFRILTTVSSRPGLCSADLARIYDVKPQSMIRQIALLENRGLIAREMSSANKRLLELTLTDKGRATLDACHTAAQKVEHDLLQSLSGAEQDQLRTILQTLQRSIQLNGGGELEELSDEYRRLGVQRV